MAYKPASVLLDTNVLIEFLKGKPRTMSLFMDLAVRHVVLATSCISVAELYAGMRKSEEEATEELLSTLDCVPVTQTLAQRAGLIRAEQMRKGRTFTLDDMIVAATSLDLGYPLVTDNRRDFDIPEIELYPSY